MIKRAARVSRTKCNNQRTLDITTNYRNEDLSLVSQYTNDEIVKWKAVGKVKFQKKSGEKLTGKEKEIVMHPNLAIPSTNMLISWKKDVRYLLSTLSMTILKQRFSIQSQITETEVYECAHKMKRNSASKC